MLHNWLSEAARSKLIMKLPAMAPAVAPSELDPEPSIAAASAADGIWRGIKDVIVVFLARDNPSGSVYFSKLRII